MGKKYQIGTPDMLIRQAEFDKKIAKMRDHKLTEVIFLGVVAVVAISMGFVGIRYEQRQAQLRLEDRLEAEALLENACIKKGGTIYNFEKTSTPILCLSEDSVIFSVDHSTSKEAQNLLVNSKISQNPP